MPGARRSLRGVTTVRESVEEAVHAIRLVGGLESEVVRAAHHLREALTSGHKLLTCGNGGSAADSSHLATEIACRFVQTRRPFPALSLCADSSVLTATANDFSYEEVFARQVLAYGQPGDVLVGISTSGDSANVARALAQGRAGRLVTVSLLGRDGGRCRGLADVEVLVPHGVTARIQEAHKVIIHLLCELIEPALQEASGSKAQ